MLDYPIRKKRSMAVYYYNIAKYTIKVRLRLSPLSILLPICFRSPFDKTKVTAHGLDFSLIIRSHLEPIDWR